MQEETSNLARFVRWLIEHWEIVFITPLAVSAALFNVAQDHFRGTRTYTVREILFINGRSILAGMMAYWVMEGIYPALNSNIEIFLVLYASLNSDKFFELILSRGLWDKLSSNLTKKLEKETRQKIKKITKQESDD